MHNLLTRPISWGDRGWGRSVKHDNLGLWFLDVTESLLGGHDQYARLGALLSDVVGAKLTPKATGRPVPLVVVPVIGTAGGV